MSDFCIEFSNPTDPRTGFLCNDSNHGFMIDGKWWPTVEHYTSAMLFEGTQYEDEIRLAPTVTKVRQLIKPKQMMTEQNGNIVYVTVYGKNSNYRCKENVDKRSLLEKALRVKFSNERLYEKLCRTGKARLVDKTNNLTGPILQKIRQTSPVVPPSPTEDLVGVDTPSGQENDIIECMMKLSRRVMLIEKCSEIHDGMVEDAVFSVAGQEAVDYITSIYVDKNWSVLKSSLPKLVKLIERVVADTGCSPKCGYTIAGLIKWLRVVPKSKRDATVKNVTQHSTVTIVLQKKQRPYRTGLKDEVNGTVMKGTREYIRIVEEEIKAINALNEQSSFSESDSLVPPSRRRLIQEVDGLSLFREASKLVVTGANLPNKASALLSLGGQYDTRKEVVQNTDVIKFTGETVKTHMDRLTALGGHITKKGSVLIKGDTLVKYRSTLLRMGGKYPVKTTRVTDKTSITFPIDKLDSVLKSLTAQSNTNTRVVSLILDIAQCIAKKNVITGAIVHRVAKYILSLPVSVVSKGTTEKVNEIVESGKYNVSNEAIHLLSQYHNSKTIANSSRIRLVPGLSHAETVFVMAMRNVAEVVKSFVTAFLVICPKRLRRSAKQFIESLECDSCTTLDLVRTTLTAKGISYKPQVVELDDVRSLVGGSCNIAILIASLHFFSPSVRKEDYNEVLMRATSMIGDIEEDEPVVKPAVKQSVKPTAVKESIKPTVEPIVKPTVTKESIKPAVEPIVKPTVTKESIKPTVMKEPVKPTAKPAFTEGSMMTPMSRGVIYIKTFGSIGLTDEEYSNQVTKLESLPQPERLKMINDLNKMNDVDKKMFLLGNGRVRNATDKTA